MVETVIQNVLPWGGAAGIILAVARLVKASCHGAAEVMQARQPKALPPRATEGGEAIHE